MYPKNSKILYKKISEELNCNEELVSDYLSFVFCELRKNLTEFKEIKYNIPFLGSFEATLNLISKEEARIVKEITKGKAEYNASDRLNIDIACIKAIDESIRHLEVKLKKNEWHEKNGDPFKRYNKEQMENIRRDIELLKEKRSYRESRKKKNEEMLKVRP